MYNIPTIRADFPILSRQVNGKPLVYLDNAATSHKPQVVIDAIVDYYSRYNSNVHRGVHTLSAEATDAYEAAREKIAGFINAPSAKNLIFVRNTSEAINLIAYSWARYHIGRGDRILTTEIEHHSNLVPWQHVAQEAEAELKFISMASDYNLELSDLSDLLTPSTKLVAFTHMSNVLGTITPAKDLVAAAHRVGALALIDAAQSVPHMPIDVQDLDCDFLAFSGHKMTGPMGIGVLYVKDEVLGQMEPFMRGGEMVLEVTYETASWADLPMKFEAGTPSVADAIGLGAAVDYLTQLGMDSIREHEIGLMKYALQRIQEIEEVAAYGPSNLSMRGGVISFSMGDIHPHDIGQVLDHSGVAIRTGHHCAMPLVRSKLHLPATARASFYLYNSEEEVDALVDSLQTTVRYFGDTNARRS